jgi:XTP/dITP diphosphohydrolase
VTIYFLSSNPHKTAEAKAYVTSHRLAETRGVTVCFANLDVQEILHSDLTRIVRQKALDAHRLLRHPCVVEHSGLYMAGLPGLPGGLGKIIWDCVQDRLCSFLRDTDSREAIAKSYLGYCDGRRLHVFAGETPGTIAERARGNYTFGWDPIFIPQGSSETYGEMGQERKAATSPMARAWDAFVATLDTDV